MIRGLLHGIRRCLLRVTQGLRPAVDQALSANEAALWVEPVSICLSKTRLYHAFFCRGHPSGAHIVVFVDRGDMEHVACRGYSGGG